MDSEVARAIKKYAPQFGFRPQDVATIFSYETGGTLNPWQRGPTTKWGQHRGLIQWGEPQRKKYNVTKSSSVDHQVKQSMQYMKDRGAKPGQDLLGLYATVNAGAVNKIHASDAAAGGAPGSVLDKVNNQMGGHMQRAQALLGTTPSQIGSHDAAQTFGQQQAYYDKYPSQSPTAGQSLYEKLMGIQQEQQQQMLGPAALLQSMAPSAMQSPFGKLFGGMMGSGLGKGIGMSAAQGGGGQDMGPQLAANDRSFIGI